ncbi:uncharacterized protein LOC103483664 [Cucumis melo]|uniref:Serine-aspartate repeat-containing protein F isoform X1 n=1 Tax=Cucumis melo TaxID=3656 RepID=A0A1S4DSH5_CUCME|nr:uncharacterized protein LOC103483664 [Cucumis melo]XP_016898918.1 uncharacterized protein LOC103483664 [Cucumis melo]
MGNEMGNNNTSEFREEEKEKAEGPELFLLEGGKNEGEADEVAGFSQKEARPSSGEADKVNGDHHVSEKEEEKNKVFDIEEFQVVSENLHDQTIEDNVVEVKSKENKEMECDSEENRSDKQASSQKEEEEKRGSNLNTTVLSLNEPKLEKTEEKCKDALESSSKNTCHSADCAVPDSEENTNMNQVIDTDRDTNKENDGEKGKGSVINMITHASEDEKSETTSDVNVDQVIDNDGDTDKENDGERGRGSSFNTTTHAPKDPKSEINSDFDSDQVIDTDVDAHKENDEERRKGSNFEMTNSSENPKSEKTSNLDSNQVVRTDWDADKENDEGRGNSSNFDMLIDASKDPNSENSSNLRCSQHESPETNAESLTGSSDDGGTDMEKKKGDLVEPRQCHGYTAPAAKNVDTKDKGTVTDVICHNTSGSLAEECLVIESPNSSVQVPEVEDKVEFQLREERLGTETVDEDNIPTQSKISNEVQEEFNTTESHSEKNAEEAEVSPEFVAENKNEAPVEDCEDSDGEYLEISEQGMDILNLSIGDCKHKNEEMGETTELSTSNEHEAERREPDESPFEPILGFQPQTQQKETTIVFQTAESTDESISAPRQETDTETEKSKSNPSDSLSYTQTASSTPTETKPSTNPIDEQSLATLPFSTFGGEDQDSPGRTSNESISENSIGQIEMRKSPSFNIDIQIEGKTGETEKTPLLYQIKTIEDLSNLQEISFPNPMEKRVVKLGRSDSEKSRPSFPGFVKEKEESGMEFKAIDQNNFVNEKKVAKNLPPPSPIRKGKRRTKSLIFGTCICCATAIN